MWTGDNLISPRTGPGHWRGSSDPWVTHCDLRIAGPIAERADFTDGNAGGNVAKENLSNADLTGGVVDGLWCDGAKTNGTELPKDWLC